MTRSVFFRSLSNSLILSIVSAPETISAPNRAMNIAAMPPAAPLPGTEPISLPAKELKSFSRFFMPLSSTRSSFSPAPFCGAKVFAAPFSPVMGLLTSQNSFISAFLSFSHTSSASILTTLSVSAPQPKRIFPSASKNLTPSAAAAPMPPSLVAEPPRQRTICFAPRESASSTSSPVPKLDARMMSRSFSFMRASPEAAAISMTAVFPPTMPYSAATGSPSGPVTVQAYFTPPKVRTMISAVPSPPSAMGRGWIVLPGRIRLAASAIAAMASSAVRLPLNLSGARTIRSFPPSLREYLRFSGS